MSKQKQQSDLAGTDAPDRSNTNKKLDQLEASREDATTSIMSAFPSG